MRNNILAILKKRGKSQGWLSQASGIARPQLCKTVSGKVRSPSVRTAIKIAKALGVPVEEIWKV